jgi:hypothetical protein
MNRLMILAFSLGGCVDVFSGCTDLPFRPSVVRDIALYGGAALSVCGIVALLHGAYCWLRGYAFLRSIGIALVFLFYGGLALLHYYVSAPVYLEIA